MGYRGYRAFDRFGSWGWNFGSRRAGGYKGGALDEVWYSVDGKSWTAAPDSAPSFSPRGGHQAVVHSVLVAYRVADVEATGPTAVVTIPANRRAPVTLATIRATGGSGGLRFEVAADALGGMSVGATDGVLVATLLPGFGRFATVTIRVEDATTLNLGAEVAVTVFRRARAVFSPSSASLWCRRILSGLCIRCR